MKFIGEYLRESRNSKNLTLSEVSKDLKIAIGVLQNIEGDNYPDYINHVYLIGHIRSYSKYLNLDQDLIVKRFKTQILFNNNEIKHEISKPIEKINFSLMPKIIAFSSFIFIAASFYILFIKPNNLEFKYAMTPDLPENLNYILEETQMDIALEKIKDNSQKNTNKRLLLKNNLNLHNSALASIPDNNKINGINKIITLKFIGSTWFQLRDEKNNIVISKLMNSGEEYSYNSINSLFVTAGNAGNILILIDGMLKGKAGKSGEVVESLIVDINFKN